MQYCAALCAQHPHRPFSLLLYRSKIRNYFLLYIHLNKNKCVLMCFSLYDVTWKMYVSHCKAGFSLLS